MRGFWGPEGFMRLLLSMVWLAQGCMSSLMARDLGWPPQKELLGAVIPTALEDSLS
jgi:hypothetical protein